MKILEWNLHGMTGSGKGKDMYSIPINLIVGSIEKEHPEILVFTEFISNDNNIDELKKELKTIGYHNIFCSTQYKGRNGICIAINGEDKECKLVTEGGADEVYPDYLAVEVSYKANNNNPFVIAGVRLHSKETNKTIEWLLKNINKDKKNIMIGDFNKSKNQLKTNREIVKYKRKNMLEIHGEEKDDSGLDLIDATKISIIDHLITNFVPKNISVQYSWNYMVDLYNSINNKATYINMRCIPDHAMLIAEINM